MAATCKIVGIVGLETKLCISYILMPTTPFKKVPKLAISVHQIAVLSSPEYLCELG